MRTFRPAAPGSTSRTEPARNPCRAHNDVRGDRPVRQPRRRPGQHETGQHIGLQRRQLLRRHRRPRHPQIPYGCQAQTRASGLSAGPQQDLGSQPAALAGGLVAQAMRFPRAA